MPSNHPSEIATARTETARSVALIEQASQALADGDKEQTQRLLNAAHTFGTAAKGRLIRLEQEAVAS